MRVKGIELLHLGLTLLKQNLGSGYEFSVFYGVLLMAPATSQPFTQRPTAMRTTTVTYCAEFSLTDRHEFSERILLSLQLSELSILESKLTLTRVATKTKFVFVTALIYPLAYAHPN